MKQKDPPSMLANERLIKIILLVEGVLAGTLAASEALKSWPDIDSEMDPTIKSLWHDLAHFADDFDLRSRDPKYEDYQRGLIEAGLS